MIIHFAYGYIAFCLTYKVTYLLTTMPPYWTAYFGYIAFICSEARVLAFSCCVFANRPFSETICMVNYLLDVMCRKDYCLGNQMSVDVKSAQIEIERKWNKTQ